jgi:hypothetical protein
MEGDVSKSWTKDLQKKFESLVKSNQLSSHKILEARHGMEYDDIHSYHIFRVILVLFLISFELN